MPDDKFADTIRRLLPKSAGFEILHQERISQVIVDIARHACDAAVFSAERDAANAPLLRLVAEVQRLHDIDARHKRGWRLSQRSSTDALFHTIEELTEVGLAKTDGEVTSELGDVLGLLIHFAIKAGVSLDDAAESALAKLPIDFPESGTVRGGA